MVVTVAVMLLLSITVTPVYADEASDGQLTDEQSIATALEIEQVRLNMPTVDVWMHVNSGAGFTSDNIKAQLGEQNLTTVSVTNVAETDGGTLYIFLVDISLSITSVQMDSIKGALTDFSASLKPNDRIILISFGTEVTTLYDGTAEAGEVQFAIDTLVPADQETHLFNAIKQALELSANEVAGYPERKVIVTISDGVDEDYGYSYSKEEVLRRLRADAMPVYAIGFDNNNGGLNDFGELARESGGRFATVDQWNISSNLAAFDAYIRSAYKVTFAAANNKVSGQTENLAISVTFGDHTIPATVQVDVLQSQSDNQFPSVTGIEQIDDTHIQLTFDKRLVGADASTAYTIKDSSGTQVIVAAAKFLEIDGSYIAELTLAQVPYSGEYTIEFSGITDDSAEANPLIGTEVIAIDGQPIVIKYLKIVFFDFWWVILLVILLVVLLIVFLYLRNRKGLVKVDGRIGFGDSLEFKHRFQTPQSKSIALIVTDVKGNANKIELELNSSLFVGRASINNLSFDDTKMSRQHFVIETTDDGYYVTDLGTTNGTFLNGNRIEGRLPLAQNDVITAGNEKFVFKAEEE
jgi:Mg-chelatase subunit ChlD